MSGIYDTFIRIALTGDVAEKLAVISARVLTMENQVGRLTKAFHGFGEAAKVALGGVALAAGGIALMGLKKLADEAGNLSHQLANIKKQGVDLQSFAQARQAIFGTVVPGISYAQVAQIYGQERSLLGDAETRRILGSQARLASALGGISGDWQQAVDQVQFATRAAHEMGWLSDPKTGELNISRFQKFQDLVVKMAGATHGRVGPREILQFAQQAGPMARGLDERGLATLMAEIQVLGGFRAGTAWMSLGQQLRGGIMKRQAAEELSRLGLIGPPDEDTARVMGHLGAGAQISPNGRVLLRRRGAYHVGPPGPMIFSHEALNSPFAQTLERSPLEALDMLLEAMAKKGITSPSDIQTELFRLFPRQTANRIMSDLIMNRKTIGGEVNRALGALGVEGALNVQNKEDYQAVANNLNAAWTRLKEVLGLSTQQIVIPVMRNLTDALDALGNVVKNHQNIFRWLLEIVGVGSAAAAAAGAGAVAGAGVGLLGGPAGAAGGALLGGMTGILGAIAGIHWEDAAKFFKSLGDLFSKEKHSDLEHKSSYFGEMREGQSIMPISSQRLADQIGRGIIRAAYFGSSIGGGSRSYSISYGDGGGSNIIPFVPRGSGGAFAGGGATGGAVQFGGTLRQNQMEAYQAARAAGLSERAARALVANMTGESLRNPGNKHWDRSHFSQGIVQWDDQRSAAIARQFGKEPRFMSVSEQTRAAIWEIMHNPRFAPTRRALESGDPRQMMEALVRNYEAPANQAAEIVRRFGYYQGLGKLGETAHPNHGRMGTVKPYQRRAPQHAPIEANLYIDGRQVYSSVVAHAVRDTTHPRQAPYFNGVRHYAGPDRQTNTA